MELHTIELLKEIKSLIQDKITNRWMNIHEVSNYTSVSSSTIRRAVQRGELKVSNSTGKLLFNVSDVERWLNG
jgi:excisionase family DNA binding protein